MFKKLLITLKYGETKVKMYLIGVIVLLIAGFILLVLGISGKSLIFLGTGAVLLIAGLLVMFSFSFVDIDVDLDKKIVQKKEKKKEVKKVEKKEPEEESDENMDIDFSMLEEDLNDLAIGVDGLALGAGKGNKEKSKENTESGKDQDNSAETGGSDGDSDDENVEAILKEIENYGEFDDGDGAEGTASEAGNKNGTSRRREDDVYEVKKPTPKEIKARKKMLKVRRDDRRFTPIFVDTWREARVMHTPAFVQDKGKTANIVLIEGALRTELIPMSEFLKVTYQRGVEEKFAEDFDKVKNDPEVNAIFAELLPALYQGSAGYNSEIMCKNLYWLGGKIAITPRSLRKLFNKFDFEFHVFDSLEIKGKYSKYFKQAYENRIFWTDNVISQNDYQERIRRLLQSMVDNTELKTAEFEADLDLMVRYNLITIEYADYYKARKRDNIKIKI
jgi:hypothetical protein